MTMKNKTNKVEPPEQKLVQEQSLTNASPPNATLELAHYKQINRIYEKSLERPALKGCIQIDLGQDVKFDATSPKKQEDYLGNEVQRYKAFFYAQGTHS